MTSRSSPVRHRRVNSLITLMCEEAGIDVPGEDAYTSRSPTPLTHEQIQWVKALIEEREQREAPVAQAAPISNDSGNAASTSQTLPAAQQQVQPPNNGLTCDQCGKSFKSKRTFQQHATEVHVGTTCYWRNCDHVADNEADLNRHLKWHNGVHAANDPDGHLICHWPGCGAKCTMEETVARHLRRHQTRAKIGHAA